MGWKNVKEHYGIDELVHVYDDKVSVGSDRLLNIITIESDMVPTRRYSHGEPFDGWTRAMLADLGTLRRLIETPDTFARSIPVYTFDYDGNIIEKQCEALGWPNVTHDGCLMYDNHFFPDRAEAVAGARRELRAAVNCAWTTVLAAEIELAEDRELLARYEAVLAKLEAA